MKKERAVKRFFAVFFSLIYIQVNVAWCGVPTFPLPLQTYQMIRQLFRNNVIASPTRRAKQSPNSLPEYVFMSLLRSLRSLAMTPSLGTRKKVSPDDVFVFHQGYLEWQEELLRGDHQARPVEGVLPPPILGEDNQPAQPREAGNPRAPEAGVPEGRRGQPEQKVSEQDVANIRSAPTDERLADVLASLVPLADVQFKTKESFLGLLSMAGDPAKATQFGETLVRANQALDGIGLHLDVVKGTDGRFHLEVGQIKAPSQVSGDGWKPGDLRTNVGLLTGGVVQVKNYEIISRPVEKNIQTHGLNQSVTSGDVTLNVIYVNLTELKASFAQSQREGSPLRGQIGLGDFYRKTLAHEMGHAYLNEINPQILKGLDGAKRSELHEFFAQASELLLIYDANPGNNARIKMAVLNAVANNAFGGPNGRGIEESPAHKNGATLVIGALLKALPGPDNMKDFNRTLIPHLNGLRNNPEAFNQFFKDALQKKVHEVLGPEVLPGPRAVPPEAARPDQAGPAEASAAGIKERDLGQPILLDKDPARNAAQVKALFFGIENYNLDLGKAWVQTYRENGQQRVRLLTEVKDPQGKGEWVAVYKTMVNGNPVLQIETTAKGAVALGMDPGQVQGMQRGLGGRASSSVFVIFSESGHAPLLYVRDDEGKVFYAPTDRAAEANAGNLISLPAFMNDGVHRFDYGKLEGQEARVTKMNVGTAVRMIGYGGSLAEVNWRHADIAWGTRIIKTEHGIYIDGRITFTTPQGLTITLEGTKEGKVEQTIQAGAQQAEFVEYGPNRNPVAVTLLNPGDKEVRVNNQLVYFEAHNGPILRKVLTPQVGGEGQGNGNGPQPPEMRGGVGEYVVREGSMDSVFKMDHGTNKVILTEMRSVFGQVIALRNAAGIMESQVPFEQGGIEKKFEVLGGPTFDPHTGQGVLKVNVLVGKAGEWRMLEPQRGEAGGHDEQTPGHRDKDLIIRDTGDGKFVKIAKTDQAVMAAKMNLDGRTQQVASLDHQNITYQNSRGVTIGSTLDKVKIVHVDLSGKRTEANGSQIVWMSHKPEHQGDVEAFRAINVVDNSGLNIVPVNTSGDWVPTDGEIVYQTTLNSRNEPVTSLKSMDINYQLDNGSKINFSMKDNRAVVSVEASRETTVQLFDPNQSPSPGENVRPTATIIVPGNGEKIQIDLHSGFLPRNGSYQHLDGVRVINAAGDVTLRYDTAAQKVRVENVHLFNGGRTTFTGVQEDFLKPKFNPEVNAQLSGAAVFEGGRIFFGLTEPIKLENQILTVAHPDGSISEVKETNFTGRYMTFGMDGKKSLSAEVTTHFSHTPITLKKSAEETGERRKDLKGEAPSAGIATPGADTKNIEIDETGREIKIQTGYDGKFAALITEGKDERGQVRLLTQFNLFSSHAENILAPGKNGFNFGNFKVGEGLAISLTDEGVLVKKEGAFGKPSTLEVQGGGSFEFESLGCRWVLLDAQGGVQNLDGSVKYHTPKEGRYEFPKESGVKAEGVSVEITRQGEMVYRGNGKRADVKADITKEAQVIWQTGSGAPGVLKSGLVEVTIAKGMKVVTKSLSLAAFMKRENYDIESGDGPVRAEAYKFEGGVVPAELLPANVTGKVERTFILEGRKDPKATFEQKAKISFSAKDGESLQRDGSGLVTEGNARFTASDLNFSDLECTHGKVTLVGARVTTTYNSEDGKAKVTVSRQSRAVYTPGRKDPEVTTEKLAFECESGSRREVSLPGGRTIQIGWVNGKTKGEIELAAQPSAKGYEDKLTLSEGTSLDVTILRQFAGQINGQTKNKLEFKTDLRYSGGKTTQEGGIQITGDNEERMAGTFNERGELTFDKRSSITVGGIRYRSNDDGQLNIESVRTEFDQKKLVHLLNFQTTLSPLLGRFGELKVKDGQATREFYLLRPLENYASKEKKARLEQDGIRFIGDYNGVTSVGLIRVVDDREGDHRFIKDLEGQNRGRYRSEAEGLVSFEFDGGVVRENADRTFQTILAKASLGKKVGAFAKGEFVKGTVEYVEGNATARAGRRQNLQLIFTGVVGGERELALNVGENGKKEYVLTSNARRQYTDTDRRNLKMDFEIEAGTKFFKEGGQLEVLQGSIWLKGEGTQAIAGETEQGVVSNVGVYREEGGGPGNASAGGSSGKVPEGEEVDYKSGPGGVMVATRGRIYIQRDKDEKGVLCPAELRFKPGTVFVKGDQKFHLKFEKGYWPWSEGKVVADPELVAKKWRYLAGTKEDGSADLKVAYKSSQVAREGADNRESVIVIGGEAALRMSGAKFSARDVTVSKDKKSASVEIIVLDGKNRRVGHLECELKAETRQKPVKSGSTEDLVRAAAFPLSLEAARLGGALVGLGFDSVSTGRWIMKDCDFLRPVSEERVTDPATGRLIYTKTVEDKCHFGKSGREDRTRENRVSEPFDARLDHATKRDVLTGTGLDSLIDDPSVIFRGRAESSKVTDAHDDIEGCSANLRGVLLRKVKGTDGKETFEVVKVGGKPYQVHIDALRADHFIMRNPNNSDYSAHSKEKLKEHFNDFVEFIARPNKSGEASDRDFNMQAYYRTSSTLAAYQNLNVRWGLSDFGKVVDVAGTAIADKLRGTHHAVELLSGREGGGRYKMTAISEMAQGGRDMTDLAQGNTTTGQLMEDIQGRGSWVRSVDLFLGDLLGTNRIMNIYSVGSFMLAWGEQALNFATLGGGTGIKLGGQFGLKILTKIPWLGRAIGWAAKAGESIKFLNFATRTGQLTKSILQFGSTVERSGKAFAIWRVGRAGIKEVLGRGLQLYFRKEAAKSIGAFIETWNEKGWGEETREALGNAVWNTVVSEIGWMGPLMGGAAKWAGGSKVGQWISHLTGIGGKAPSIIRQLATAAVAGAVANVTYHLIRDGKADISSIGTQALIGAATGAIGYGVFRGLNAVGRATGLGKGIDGLNTAAKSRNLSRMESVRKYLYEGFQELGVMGRNMAIGATLMMGFQLGQNIANGKPLFESWKGILNQVGQGALLGFLILGGLAAVSKWGEAGRNLRRVGGLDEFNWERLKAGFSMGTWEVVFNNPELWQGLGLGGGGMYNPLNWATGISEYLESTGFLGPPQSGGTERDEKSVAAKSWDKFLKTSVNIAGLHPFFSFGRIGKNPVVDPANYFAQSLSRQGSVLLARGSAWAFVPTLTGQILQRTVAMPMTIKTFELFEKASVGLAIQAGLISEPGVIREGSPRDGTPKYASEEEKLGHLFFRVIGFINAPIHASQSGEQKYSQEKLAGRDSRFSDFLLPKKWVEERKKEASKFAGDVLSTAEGGDDSFRFQANGRDWEIRGDSLKQVRQSAQAALSRDTAVGEVANRVGPPGEKGSPGRTPDLVVLGEAGVWGASQRSEKPDQAAGKGKTAGKGEETAPTKSTPEASATAKASETKSGEASGEKSAKKTAEKMTWDDAVAVQRAHQAGADVKPEELARAREILHIKEGEIIIVNNDGFRSRAASGLVEMAPDSEVAKLKDLSVDGIYHPEVADFAVVRLNPTFLGLGRAQVLSEWRAASFLLKDSEEGKELLKVIGSNWRGMIQTEGGDRVIQATPLLEGLIGKKILDSLPDGTKALIRENGGILVVGRGVPGIIIGGLTKGDLNERAEMFAQAPTRGSPEKTTQGPAARQSNPTETQTPLAESKTPPSKIPDAFKGRDLWQENAPLSLKVTFRGDSTVSRFEIYGEGNSGPRVSINPSEQSMKLVGSETVEAAVREGGNGLTEREVTWAENRSSRGLFGRAWDYFIGRGNSDFVEYNSQGEISKAGIRGDSLANFRGQIEEGKKAREQRDAKLEGETKKTDDLVEAAVQGGGKSRKSVDKLAKDIYAGVKKVISGESGAEEKQDALADLTEEYVGKFQASDDVSADDKGRAVRKLAQRVEGSNTTDDVKEFFRHLVVEVDRAGCSSCMAKYTDPALLRQAWPGVLGSYRSEATDPGNSEMRDEFALDRMRQETGKLNPDFNERAAKATEGPEGLKGTDADLLKKFSSPESPVDRTGDRRQVGDREFEYLDAKARYHEHLAQQLERGTPDRKVGRDRESQRLGREVLRIAGARQSIEILKGRLDLAEEKLSRDHDDSAPDLKRGIAALRRMLTVLGRQVKEGRVEALEALKQFEVETEVVETFTGSVKLDAEKVQRLFSEIESKVSDPGAKKALRVVVEKVIEGAKSEGPKGEDNFLRLNDLFVQFVSAVFGDRMNGEEFNNNLGVLCDKGASSPEGQEALRKIFPHKSAGSSIQLDVAERVALAIVVRDYYFKHYDDKTGEKKAAQEREKDKAAKLRDAKQNALLIHFMLGRVGGLAAGGGKTAVFISAFGEYAMRPENRDRVADKGMAFELVVFNEGEVGKYINGYKPLFRAFGLESRDGRNLAGSERARAEPTYTTKPGEVSVVVSDLHSRGFLERLLRAEPDSNLTHLINSNVKAVGLDEVDALLLSRTSFISSDDNLVASKAERDRVDHIVKVVVGVFGKELGKDDFSQRDRLGCFRKGALEDDGREVWYTKTDSGSIIISKKGWEKIQEKLNELKGTIKGDPIDLGEVLQVVRAMDAVGDDTEFGFTKEHETDPHDRPTSKMFGRWQRGQIDSSVTFNVAATIFGRAVMELRLGGKSPEVDKELPMDDIRLSDAGTMATFVQVLQRNKGNHLFGGTGTSESIKKLSRLVIGREVVEVEPSAYVDYKRRTVQYDSAAVGSGFSKTIMEIYKSFDRYTKGKDLAFVDIGEGTERLTGNARIDEINKRKQLLAGQAILASLEEGSGILVGTRGENDLALALYGYMELKGMGDIVKDLKASHFKSIGELVETAKKKVSDKWTNKESPQRVAMDRIRVVDGNEKSPQALDDIVKEAAEKKYVVLATEYGLRAQSYDAKGDSQIDLLLMGTEGFSTESNLQAFARVDRDTSRGARRTVLVDSQILRARVGEALKVDGNLKAKFGRQNGLGLTELNGVTEGRIAEMDLDTLVRLSGDYGSHVGLGSSALFFINEQISSKLIKEPLAAMIAKERRKGNESGAKALDDLRIELLKNSDRYDVSQGLNQRDPMSIAQEAFQKGLEQAKGALARIINNNSVSMDIRLEAAERYADILQTESGFADRLRATNADGRHEGSQYENAAFVNVSERVKNSPAQMVANVVILLSELLLPVTETGAKKAEASGFTAASAAVSRSANTRGPTAEAGSQAVEAAAPAEKSDRTATPVSYRQEAETVAQAKFEEMSPTELEKARRDLVSSGVLISASPDLRVLAKAVVARWNLLGGRDDQFDIDAILQSASVIAAAANDGQIVDGRIAVRAALAPDTELPLLREHRGQATPTHRMEALAEGVLDVAASQHPDQRKETLVQEAEKVVTAAQATREQRAFMENRPTGRLWGRIWDTVKYFGLGIWHQIKPAESQFFKRQKSALEDLTGQGRGGSPAERQARKDEISAVATLLTGLSGKERANAGKILDAAEEASPAQGEEKGFWGKLWGGISDLYLKLTGQFKPAESDLFKELTAADLARAAGSGANAQLKVRLAGDPLAGLREVIKDKEKGFVRSLLDFKKSWALAAIGLGIAAVVVSSSAVLPAIVAASPVLGKVLPIALLAGVFAAKVISPEALFQKEGQKKPGRYGNLMKLATVISTAWFMGATAAAAYGAYYLGGFIGKGSLAKLRIVGKPLAKLWDKLPQMPIGASLTMRAVIYGEGSNNLGELTQRINRDRAVPRSDKPKLFRLALILMGVTPERAGELKELFEDHQAKADELRENPDVRDLDPKLVRELVALYSAPGSKDDKEKGVAKLFEKYGISDDGLMGRVGALIVGTRGDDGFLALQKRTFQELKDDKNKLDFLIEVGKFEFNAGGLITPEAVKAKFGDVSSDRNNKARKVYELYAGRELKVGEIGDINRACSRVSDARTDLIGVKRAEDARNADQKLLPSAPQAKKKSAEEAASRQRNLIQEAAWYLPRHGLAYMMAQNVAEVFGENHPLAQMALQVGEQKARALSQICRKLVEAGATPESVNEFAMQVQMTDDLERSKDALAMVRPTDPSKTAEVQLVKSRISGENPLTRGKGELAESYFSELPVGMALHEFIEPKFADASLRLLQSAGVVHQEPFGGKLWQERRPYYQALSMMAGAQGLRVVIEVTGSGANRSELWSVYQVQQGEGGQSTVEVARIHRIDNETINVDLLSLRDPNKFVGTVFIKTKPDGEVERAYVVVERGYSFFSAQGGNQMTIKNPTAPVDLYGSSKDMQFQIGLENPQQKDQLFDQGPVCKLPTHMRGFKQPSAPDRAPFLFEGNPEPQKPLPTAKRIPTARPLSLDNSDSEVAAAAPLQVSQAVAGAENPPNLSPEEPINVGIDEPLNGWEAMPEDTYSYQEGSYEANTGLANWEEIPEEQVPPVNEGTSDEESILEEQPPVESPRAEAKPEANPAALDGGPSQGAPAVLAPQSRQEGQQLSQTAPQSQHREPARAVTEENVISRLFTSPDRDRLEERLLQGKTAEGLGRAISGAIVSQESLIVHQADGSEQGVTIYDVKYAGRTGLVVFQIMVPLNDGNGFVYVTKPQKELSKTPVFYQMSEGTSKIILDAIHKREAGGVEGLAPIPIVPKDTAEIVSYEPWIADGADQADFRKALERAPLAEGFVEHWMGQHPDFSPQLQGQIFLRPEGGNEEPRAEAMYLKGGLFRGRGAVDSVGNFVHEFSHAALEYLRKTDPALYAEIIKYFQTLPQMSEFRSALSRNPGYKNKPEELIAHEAFAFYIQAAITGNSNPLGNGFKVVPTADMLRHFIEWGFIPEGLLPKAPNSAGNGSQRQQRPEPSLPNPAAPSVYQRPVAPQKPGELKPISKEDAEQALGVLRSIPGIGNLSPEAKFFGVDRIFDRLKGTAVCRPIDGSKSREADLIACYRKGVLIRFVVMTPSGQREVLNPGAKENDRGADRLEFYKFDISKPEESKLNDQGQIAKGITSPINWGNLVKGGVVVAGLAGIYVAAAKVIPYLQALWAAITVGQAAPVGGALTQIAGFDPTGLMAFILVGIAVTQAGQFLMGKKTGLLTRDRSAPAAGEAAMLQVPTRGGMVGVGFAPGAMEALKPLVQGKTNEQAIFAVAEKQGGNYVITGWQTVPQIQVMDGPRYPTECQRELVAALASGTPVADLLGNSRFESDMKMINLTPLLTPLLRSAGNSQEMALAPAEIRSRLESGENIYLGETVDLIDSQLSSRQAASQQEGLRQFKEFVFGLVERNGVSVAAPSGVYFAGNVLTEGSGNGRILIPLHSEPVRAGQALSPSFIDRMSSWSLRRFFAENNLENPGFLLMTDQSASRLTFFDEHKKPLLTVDDQLKPVVAEHPRYNSYQNPEILLADEIGNGRPSGLLGLLPSWLVRLISPEAKPLKPDAAALFLGEDSGGKPRAELTQALSNMVNYIARNNVDYTESRAAFKMAGFHALGLMKRPQIQDYLTQFSGSTLGLEKLIVQLGEQMRNNPAAMKFAPSMDAVHGIVRHFLRVSAWPMEKNWLLNRVNEGLDVRMADGQGAGRMARDIRRSLRGRMSFDQLLEPLLALAGSGREDFANRLNEARQGVGYVLESDLRGVFAGKRGNEETQAVFLKLLAPGLLDAIVHSGPVNIDEETKGKLLSTLKIAVIQDSTPTGLRPREPGQFIKNAGRIEIRIDPKLSPDLAFAGAVAALTHELGHAVEDMALEKFSIKGLGIPTLISEAWAQFATSRALRFLNLNLIADVADLKTFEEIARQDEAQVGAFDLGVIKSVADVEVLAKALGGNFSGGRSAVVLGTTAEIRGKRAIVKALRERQFQVVNIETLPMAMISTENETPLEALGRLTFGTRKVRLITNRRAADLAALAPWKILLTPKGHDKLADDLVRTIDSIGVISRLEEIFRERWIDLVTARQA